MPVRLLVHKITFHSRFWAIYDNNVYDLSDYINSQSLDSGDFNFLNSDLVSLFQQQPGQDITKSLNQVLDALDPTVKAQNINCMSNLFYVGKPDFRNDARCQVQNVILLVISIILMVSIGIKCEYPIVRGTFALMLIT